MAKIDCCVYFPWYFTLWAKKEKNYVFLTSFGPGPNGKMVQNGKKIMNPRGSIHREQLVPNRLTLFFSVIIIIIRIVTDNLSAASSGFFMLELFHKSCRISVIWRRANNLLTIRESTFQIKKYKIFLAVLTYWVVGTVRQNIDSLADIHLQRILRILRR